MDRKVYLRLHIRPIRPCLEVCDVSSQRVSPVLLIFLLGRIFGGKEGQRTE